MASGLSITDFCTPPSYCPANSLTRERLAYFIVRAFNLPMASLDSPSFAWKGGGISHEVAYLIPKTKSLASVPDFGLPQTDKVITAPRQSLQGMTITASFVYDGDGNRVAQTVNGVTTYFVGNYYEVTGSTVTKYYYAGGQRVAMRTDTIPQNSTLSYLLADHLNSTSLTLDASGNVLSELRYTAWGEVRYASGNTPTDYTYTGQYANVDDFGLMFYNARWYDPYLNQFSQPDSIIPNPYNPQDWNRYAYARYNPLVYTDPTGHDPILGFIGGFLKELARTNLWFDPQAQKDLAIHNNESTAELTGRLVADVASMAIGVTEAGGGAGVAGGGVVACGTGVGCLVTPEAVVAGGALIAQGAGTTLSAANGAGTILTMLSRRSGDESGDDSNDPFSNIKVTTEFERRVKQYGVSDKTILQILKNGDKYTDGKGGWILWDSKSKLAIAVDKTDGELITIFESKRPSNTWKFGWFDDTGD
jgi:RHS repeat-associated protein